MQIIPAIDLKDNKCVRLSKGKDLSSVVYNKDPEKQAIYFEQIGCKKLHLIDIDAAFGRTNVNFETIKKIRKSISIPIQLGGGVRNLDLAKKYFEVGINNLIIGSMSVDKPNEVKILSNKYEDKVYVSLDFDRRRLNSINPSTLSRWESLFFQILSNCSSFPSLILKRFIAMYITEPLRL